MIKSTALNAALSQSSINLPAMHQKCQINKNQYQPYLKLVAYKQITT